MVRIPVEVEEERTGRRFPGVLVKSVALGTAAFLALRLARMDESRKRFILHLVKQVPYLPGRYFA